jgi:hypothetical protein
MSRRVGETPGPRSRRRVGYQAGVVPAEVHFACDLVHSKIHSAACVQRFSADCVESDPKYGR